MRRPSRSAAASLALAAAALMPGCGSAAPAARGPAPEAPRGGAPFLAMILATTAGTWAVAVMGGSVATNNNFWQLFARPPTARAGNWSPGPAPRTTAACSWPGPGDH
jgi:hypothetical protein